MSIEEQSLRELLASPHAPSCVRSIFGALQSGDQVTLSLHDGSVLTLENVAEAEQVLQERFSWP